MSLSNGKRAAKPQAQPSPQAHPPQLGSPTEALTVAVKDGIAEVTKQADITKAAAQSHKYASAAPLLVRKAKADPKKVQFSDDAEAAPDSESEEEVHPATRIALSKSISAADAALGEAMNLQEVEEKCRNLVHQILVPVLELTRRNIEFNTSKNDKFVEFNRRLEGLTAKLDENERLLKRTLDLSKRMDVFQKEDQMHRVDLKGRFEGLEMTLQRLDRSCEEVDMLTV